MKQKGVMLMLILIAGVATVFLAAEKGENPRQTAVVGLDAPELELRDVEGNPWRLSDYRGKTIFLNFWASWCDSCKTEKPSFQRLLTKHKDNPGILFITVLYDDDPQKAKEFMRAEGYSFRVLVDDKRVSRAYGITGVPETFVINRKGRIEEKMIGPVRWDSPRIESLLAKAASAE